MTFDLILAGVGGQGVLSMAAMIGRAAAEAGLFVKLSEVHGMAQRGGAVHSHLRLSDRPIASEWVARGTANLILGLEPLEALRYLEHLAPEGTLVTASTPVENIPDYPDRVQLLERLRALPGAIVIDAEALATAAGDPLAMNTVMVGAAAHLLPLETSALEKAISETFAHHGPLTRAVNAAAFRVGRAAVPVSVG